jgi:hypothetical protein
LRSTACTVLPDTMGGDGSVAGREKCPGSPRSCRSRLTANRPKADTASRPSSVRVRLAVYFRFRSSETLCPSIMATLYCQALLSNSSCHTPDNVRFAVFAQGAHLPAHAPPDRLADSSTAERIHAGILQDSSWFTSSLLKAVRIRCAICLVSPFLPM